MASRVQCEVPHSDIVDLQHGPDQGRRWDGLRGMFARLNDPSKSRRSMRHPVQPWFWIEKPWIEASVWSESELSSLCPQPFLVQHVVAYHCIMAARDMPVMVCVGHKHHHVCSTASAYSSSRTVCHFWAGAASKLAPFPSQVHPTEQTMLVQAHEL